MADTSFLHRTLGRTGRAVHRLGVGSSFGIGGADLEAVVEEYGVNYLYWGSLRRGGFGRAIRGLVKRGMRDDLFIVVQSYSRLATLVRPSLGRALRRLGIEQADMLLLGMWNKPVPDRILAAAIACQERGLTRHVGVSTHHRPLAPRFAEPGPFDVVHFRYNAANRGAEKEIFPELPEGAGRAGTVAFTATRWGQMLSHPAGAPGDLALPTAGDCYRFVLTEPRVDVCLTGPKDGSQLRAAIEVVNRGPMDEDEKAWMRRVGDLVYGARPKERF